MEDDHDNLLVVLFGAKDLVHDKAPVDLPMLFLYHWYKCVLVLLWKQFQLHKPFERAEGLPRPHFEMQ